MSGFPGRSVPTVHEVTRALVTHDPDPFGSLIANFLNTLTQFLNSESDDLALSLTSQLEFDASGELFALLGSFDAVPSLVCRCKSRLSHSRSVAHIRLFLLLLSHFPNLGNESNAYFLFNYFSDLSPPVTGLVFHRLLLQAIALSVNETTVHHITQTFTQALRNAMANSAELNLCVCEIFARSALFLPIDAAHRYFAIFACEVITNVSFRNAGMVSLGCVNLLKRNPRVITEAWIIANLTRILCLGETVALHHLGLHAGVR
jgi:hypothetical protein